MKKEDYLYQKLMADIYEPLFNHMTAEHDLILTHEEMDEIIKQSQQVIANYNKSNEFCSCEKPKIKEIRSNTYSCMKCFNEYRYPERGYIITKNYEM